MNSLTIVICKKCGEPYSTNGDPDRDICVNCVRDKGKHK